MPLTERQVQVGDLLLGPGSPYRWTTETEFFALVVRPTEGPRSWGHGTYAGAEWAEDRLVPLEVLIEKATMSEALEALDDLTAAFSPIGDLEEEVELRYCLGGAERMMLGRPRGLTPNTAAMAAGLIWAKCSFVCPTPFKYGAELEPFTPLTPPVYVGGKTFDYTFDYSYASVLTGGSAVIVNHGNAPAAMDIRFNGYCLDPRVSFELPDATVRTLSYSGEIASGQYVDLDTGEHTVLLNGDTNRRGSLIGEWTLLPPGSTTVRFRTATFNGATLDISYRSTWW